MSSGKLLLLAGVDLLPEEKKILLSDPCFADLTIKDSNSDNSLHAADNLCILAGPQALNHLAEPLRKMQSRRPAVIAAHLSGEESLFDKNSDLVQAWLLRPSHPSALIGTLACAYDQLVCRRSALENALALEQAREDLGDVLQIGLGLSGNRDLDSLLLGILSEAMDMTDADSGSIALVGRDKLLKRTDSGKLTFVHSLNLSKHLDFSRATVAINAASLSGYVVLDKQPIRIANAYAIAASAPYQFNKEYDLKNGFHTQSMMVVPMLGTRENADADAANQAKAGTAKINIAAEKREVIGIISLINKKADAKNTIDYSNFNPTAVIPFSAADEYKLKALSGMAGVSLENNLLIEEIETLFEGFVNASVKAIEDRDPATSGHSSRVALLTTRLAREINSTGLFHFNADQIKEIKYASLLHDFGKVSVREYILKKEKKLPESRLELVLHKLELYIMQIQFKAEQEKVRILSAHMSEGDRHESLNRIAQRMKDEMARAASWKEILIQNNEPPVTPLKADGILEEIHRTVVKLLDGTDVTILDDDEYAYLIVDKGSLRSEERLEIESHVTHTYRFLVNIPWTQTLKHIPEIAWGHHEKLNGRGYPRRISLEEIRPQTRMMTISDIFDALTAADRPYKKSLSIEQAIGIMDKDVAAGQLDGTLFDIFKSRRIGELIKAHPKGISSTEI